MQYVFEGMSQDFMQTLIQLSLSFFAALLTNAHIPFREGSNKTGSLLEHSNHHRSQKENHYEWKHHYIYIWRFEN